MANYTNDYNAYIPHTDVITNLILGRIKMRRKERMLKHGIEEAGKALERYKKIVNANQKETQRE